MYSLVVLLACIAGAYGYTCAICGNPLAPEKSYCCYKNDDSTYCCTWDEYVAGGFLDMKTVMIATVVAVAILVVVICTVLCYCCSCCPCYKRRRAGTVYNSVPDTTATTTLYQPNPYSANPKPYPPQYQPQYPPQYSQQQPTNPYYGQNAPPYTDTAAV